MARVHKEAPYQASCCDTQSEMTDDDIEACAAQMALRAKSQHQSRPLDRKNTQGHSQSERRYPFTPRANDNTSQFDRKFRDYSTVRGGCTKCNSLCHDTLKCPYVRDDNDDKGNGRER